VQDAVIVSGSLLGLQSKHSIAQFLMNCAGGSRRAQHRAEAPGRKQNDAEG
jgi:hypothetical protein